MRRKKVNNFQGKKAIECSTQNRDLYSNFVFFFSLVFRCHYVTQSPWCPFIIFGFVWDFSLSLLFDSSFNVCCCRLPLLWFNWMEVHAEKTQQKTKGNRRISDDNMNYGNYVIVRFLDSLFCVEKFSVLWEVTLMMLVQKEDTPSPYTAEEKKT